MAPLLGVPASERARRIGALVSERGSRHVPMSELARPAMLRAIAAELEEAEDLLVRCRRVLGTLAREEPSSKHPHVVNTWREAATLYEVLVRREGRAS